MVVQRAFAIGALCMHVRAHQQQRVHSRGASAPRPRVQLHSAVSAWGVYVRTGRQQRRERRGAAAQARLVERPARRRRPLRRPAAPRRLRGRMRAAAGRVRVGPLTTTRRVGAPFRVFGRRLGRL